MKKLFFVLLLINGVFYLWNILINRPDNAGEGEDRLRVSEPGVKKIILAGELPEPEREPRIVSLPSDNNPPVQRHIPLMEPVPTSEVEQLAEIGWEDSPNDFDPETGKTTIQPTEVTRNSKGISQNPEDERIENAATRIARTQVNPKIPLTSAAAVTEEADPVRLAGQEDQTKKSQTAEDELPVKQCLEIGPIPTKRAASRLKSRLGLINSRVKIYSRPTPVQSGYWVLYPPGKTFAESQANVTLLKSRGIKDLWLFKSGKLKGSISLGLFKGRSSAAQHLSDIEQTGIDAELQPWYADQERYWLRALWSKSKTELEEAMKRFIKDGEGLEISRHKAVDC